jgi:putative FmdB family regulatory protein
MRGYSKVQLSVQDDTEGLFFRTIGRRLICNIREVTMPMFDFFCKECMKVFEVTVKLANLDDDVICPYCSGKIRKLVSAPRRINIH